LVACQHGLPLAQVLFARCCVEAGVLTRCLRPLLRLADLDVC
jgi:hypothetical protein